VPCTDVGSRDASCHRRALTSGSHGRLFSIGARLLAHNLLASGWRPVTCAEYEPVCSIAKRDSDCHA
jgi:hypothetical protein